MDKNEYIDLFHKLQLNEVAFKPLFRCDDEVLALVNAVEERSYERGFVEGVKKNSESRVTKFMDGKWVGLTDKEIAEIYNQDSLIYMPSEFYRAIEAKLKEKNGND